MKAWCLVLGGAASVWDDVDALEAMLGESWPGQTLAVNDVMAHWPRRLDHVATLHPEKLAGWEALRCENGHPDGYVRWARRCRTKVDRIIQPWGGGSSGLLGVAVAYEIGCTKVILCGVPMTNDPHFAESTVHTETGKAWSSAESHWRAWERKLRRIRERTRSMSGRTREELGPVSIEWLHNTRTQEAA